MDTADDSSSMCRILAAHSNDEIESWVTAIAEALAAEVTTARDGERLEATLSSGDTFDLVVTSAQLVGRSGLQVLARARSRKVRVPFIIVTSLHGHLARVMVSNAAAQTLTSRMVDRENLGALARDIVRASKRPAPPALAQPQ